VLKMKCVLVVCIFVALATSGECFISSYLQNTTEDRNSNSKLAELPTKCP
jgi:hypothetical protein